MERSGLEHFMLWCYQTEKDIGKDREASLVMGRLQTDNAQGKGSHSRKSGGHVKQS